MSAAELLHGLQAPASLCFQRALQACRDGPVCSWPAMVGWCRRDAPAHRHRDRYRVDEACAPTVVEAHSSQVTATSTTFAHPPG